MTRDVNNNWGKYQHINWFGILLGYKYIYDKLLLLLFWHPGWHSSWRPTSCSRLRSWLMSGGCAADSPATLHICARVVYFHTQTLYNLYRYCNIRQVNFRMHTVPLLSPGLYIRYRYAQLKSNKRRGDSPETSEEK